MTEFGCFLDSHTQLGLHDLGKATTLSSESLHGMVNQRDKAPLNAESGDLSTIAVVSSESSPLDN